MEWVRKNFLEKIAASEDAEGASYDFVVSVPKTMDGLEQVAEAFVKQDPDGNGKRDTYVMKH
ncbi:hypothetical protein ACE3MS_27525 [Paenibacillus dendritiformis]|uniref:hypothetical protein n=1 Tax=Paenibacillus dendritiformis TaxID=130049 RepID=UPI003663EB60